MIPLRRLPEDQDSGSKGDYVPAHHAGYNEFKDESYLVPAKYSFLQQEETIAANLKDKEALAKWSKHTHDHKEIMKYLLKTEGEVEIDIKNLETKLLLKREEQKKINAKKKETMIVRMDTVNYFSSMNKVL